MIFSEYWRQVDHIWIYDISTAIEPAENDRTQIDIEWSRASYYEVSLVVFQTELSSIKITIGCHHYSTYIQDYENAIWMLPILSLNS